MTRKTDEDYNAAMRKLVLDFGDAAYEFGRAVIQFGQACPMQPTLRDALDIAAAPGRKARSHAADRTRSRRWRAGSKRTRKLARAARQGALPMSHESPSGEV